VNFYIHLFILGVFARKKLIQFSLFFVFYQTCVMIIAVYYNVYIQICRFQTRNGINNQRSYSQLSKQSMQIISTKINDTTVLPIVIGAILSLILYTSIKWKLFRLLANTFQNYFFHVVQEQKLQNVIF
jgi:hypothetical protein